MGRMMRFKICLCYSTQLFLIYIISFILVFIICITNVEHEFFSQNKLHFAYISEEYETHKYLVWIDEEEIYDGVCLLNTQNSLICVDGFKGHIMFQ